MTNKTMIQYFEWYVTGHPILWKKCIAQATRLADFGITHVWLPPAYKTGFYEDNVGYATYDLYDLGEFDQKGAIATKYGTKDEYLQAVQAFHKVGIEVLADTVLNHKMGSDEFEDVEAYCVNSHNRCEETSGIKQISAPTKFNFAARNNTYSKFKWNASHFNSCDWDNYTKQNCIYKFKGKEWAKDVDNENGNYDFLMGANIDFHNPKVRAELINWGQWYLDFTGIDGFRLDAVKHISASFYKEWIHTIRKQNPSKELFAVGEYWHGDIHKLHDYLEKVDYSISLFDVPLHYNVLQMSYAEGSYDLRKIFDNTLMQWHSQNAITFVDNHDSQPGQALSSFVNTWMKQVIYALILLHEKGIPCIFYGDLYGIPSTRNIPIPRLRTLIRVRHDYSYGVQTNYLDHPDLIGWTRAGDEQHPDSGIAVLLSDHHGGKKRMHMGKQFIGQTFHDCLCKIRTTVIIEEDGWGEFETQAKAVAVWVTEAAFEHLVINED
jgi:alpha-amylase